MISACTNGAAPFRELRDYTGHGSAGGPLAHPPWAKQRFAALTNGE
jgi:hypothetical protein